MKNLKEDARLLITLGQQALGDVVTRLSASIDHATLLYDIWVLREPEFRVIATPGLEHEPLATEIDGLTVIRLVRESYLGLPTPLTVVLDSHMRFLPFDLSEFDLVCPQTIDLDSVQLKNAPLLPLLPLIAAKLVAREASEGREGCTQAASRLLNSLRAATTQHAVVRLLETTLRVGRLESLLQSSPITERAAYEYLMKYRRQAISFERGGDERERTSFLWLASDGSVMARGLAWTDRQTFGEPPRTLLQIGRRRFSGESAAHLIRAGANI